VFDYVLFILIIALHVPSLNITSQFVSPSISKRISKPIQSTFHLSASFQTNPFHLPPFNKPTNQSMAPVISQQINKPIHFTFCLSLKQEVNPFHLPSLNVFLRQFISPTNFQRISKPIH